MVHISVVLFHLACTSGFVWAKEHRYGIGLNDSRKCTATFGIQYWRHSTRTTVLGKADSEGFRNICA